MTGLLWNLVSTAWFQHWKGLPPLGLILCVFVLSQALDKSEHPLVLCWCCGKASLDPDNCSYSTSQGWRFLASIKRACCTTLHLPKYWETGSPMFHLDFTHCMRWCLSIWLLLYIGPVPGWQKRQLKHLYLFICLYHRRYQWRMPFTSHACCGHLKRLLVFLTC